MPVENDRPTARPGLAAFDFDGTLTGRDSLMPFLVRVAGRRAMSSVVAGVGAELLRRGDRSRDTAKALMLRRVMTGRLATDVGEAAATTPCSSNPGSGLTG